MEACPVTARSEQLREWYRRGIINYEAGIAEPLELCDEDPVCRAAYGFGFADARDGVFIDFPNAVAPSTPPPNLELESIHEQLIDAGWIEHRDHFWSGERRFGHGKRRIQLGVNRLHIWQQGDYPRDLYAPISLTDLVWMKALEILRGIDWFVEENNT